MKADTNRDQYGGADNNIGDDARCLIDALKSNATIRKLKLDGTNSMKLPSFYESNFRQQHQQRN